MYGHEYKCQVRYSPRRLKGLGLTDGESCERVWSALRYSIPISPFCINFRHLIPSLRVSSYGAHRLYITATTLAIGEERRRAFPKTFQHNFQKAVSNLKESAQSFSECRNECKMSMEEFRQAASAMRFNLNPPNDEIYSTKPGDSIYEMYIALDRLCEYLDYRIPPTGIIPGKPIPEAWKEHRQSISQEFGGRIPANILPRDLQSRIHNLIKKEGWKVEDWWDPTAPFEDTPLWSEYEKRYAQREIRKVRLELWQAWTQRRLELDQLYGSSVHGKISLTIQC
jgi:hypothetical protein